MLKLNLVTPNKVIVSQLPVSEVTVPAFLGELCILPGHAPLMSTLSTGILTYKTAESNEEHNVVISWGYLEVTPESIQVLAETAELPEEIDKARAEAAIAKSKQQLESTENDQESFKKYQRKLKRSQVRSEITK
jgi:F-type H+-transporting ATPase subunit epsilon